MNNTETINYAQEIPDVLAAMSSIHDIMNTYNFAPKLTHLVLLRASQINACGHCVKMHTREAREGGETSERLDRVIVWEQVNDFSEREKAALAWTEALTILERKTNYAALRENLRSHFSATDISILTATIAMINLWNRIRISGH